ncbi:hypothetical protein RQP53_15520 [Paucibacter sp. APW11]|uniref:Uncharacterized protein n=1 Tax=Roseateles aquae TaxID=3077235 RepID=A0ABU3PDN0_9BURK|nr:hypothetical protein [Paucibacter sp. APW11]MDT9000684.1 hypothetical protein [Paucibacter sp. APW11]
MNADLPKLALALEYVDMAAGLYLEGGSDHAAQLLAAAAEKLLGDLGQMLGSRSHHEEVQLLLQEVALSYQSPDELPASHQQTRSRQSSLARIGELGALPDTAARQATSALLRAAWYLLESLGLENVAPERLERAIELSTIYAPD